jgi:uncharacterized protein (DUF58 family)
MWAVMGPILVCVWLAAVNYSNNLVYFVLYLLVSLTVFSLYYTRRNVAGIVLDQIRIHPGHVGGDIQMDLHLLNRDSLPAQSLSILCQTHGTINIPPQQLLIRSTALNSLAGKSGAQVEGTLRARKRGLFRLKMIEVQSSYPLGLFSASAFFKVDLPFYIYPEPIGDDKLPGFSSISSDETSADSTAPGDDFFGLRPYQPGEPLRHVAWKAYARGRPLMVKQFAGGGGPQLVLAEEPIRHLEVEARISQLTRWALIANEQQLKFGLDIKSAQIASAVGPVHLQRVLQALAKA